VGKSGTNSGVPPDWINGMYFSVSFNPNYATGGAKGSEVFALVGVTPIRESLLQCGEASCKRLILFIEYVISDAYCIFWV